MPLIQTDSTDAVTLVHYRPETLPDWMVESGVLVDTVPDPDSTKDGVPKQYYTDTDGFWYEYISR